MSNAKFKKSSGPDLKVTKNQKELDDKNPRIGSEYQAFIPDLNVPMNDKTLEKNVWNPQATISKLDYDRFTEVAKLNCIPEDSALTLLHWHNYNVERAIEDVPNYVYLTNRWSKTEIKRFLKLLDSKSNKDFSAFRKKFPKHSLGELITFYYLSVSCLRSSRVGRRYETLWRTSCLKADRLNLIHKPSDIKQRPQLSGISPFVILPPNFLPRQSLGITNDSLERDLEIHISNILGKKETKRLFHRLMLDRPFPVESLLDPRSKETEKLDNPNSGSNSDYCSHVETDSTSQNNSNDHSLPSDIFYNHEEFLDFLKDSSPPSVDLEMDENLRRLDQSLKEKRMQVDKESETLLRMVEKFKPQNGFPKLSYRWTKRELALTLTAISHIGEDFEKISQIVGTKSEAFIRDFYNNYKEKYNFEGLYKQRNEEVNLCTISGDSGCGQSASLSNGYEDPDKTPVKKKKKEEEDTNDANPSRPRRNVKPTFKCRLSDNEDEKSSDSLKNQQPVSTTAATTLGKVVKNRSPKNKMKENLP